MKLALISLNEFGDDIGNKIKLKLDIDIYSKTKISDFKLIDVTERLIKEYEGIIFVSSTGIAVRAIAPFVKNKASDPAILVIDILAKYVISLLSGHLGGANELTLRISNILGAEPIITTATDNLNIIAPDIIAKENNLVIEDMKMAKEVAALLVAGKKVAFVDEAGILKVPKGYTSETYKAEGLVYVTNKSVIKASCTKTLKLIRKNLILGIGCKKSYDSIEMEKRTLEKLRELGFSPKAVKIIASIEVKAEETAIVNLSKSLNAQFKIFNVEEIKKVEHNFKGSDFVERNVGVRAVAEPVAFLAGGANLTEKYNLNGMTMCVGEEKV